MKKRILLLAGLLSVLATSLFAAHTTVRQKVRESIEINTTSEMVWNIIKNFDKLDAWLLLTTRPLN